MLSEITKLILNQVDAAFTSNFTITSCGLLVVGNCLFLLSELSPSLFVHCLLCCCSAGVICILHLFPGYQLTLHSLAPAGRSPAVNADKEAQQAETMEVVFLSQTVCQFLLVMGEMKLSKLHNYFFK